MPHPPPRRVLITNDDGPPSDKSPYVFGLYMALVKQGWDVVVVLPASQQSWIGKAHSIHGTIKGHYYYPREPDGKGETSETQRPLKPGEVGEWILLDATPATCTNIGLHTIFPGQIDLVVSGPNYGRNTSAAFSLSSGTIGGAMSAALSKVRAIALSYGNFQHPDDLVPAADDIALKIITALWNDWGRDEESDGLSQFVLEHMDQEKARMLLLEHERGKRDGEVDLYTINIPIIPALKQEGGLKVVWTRLWRNEYGKLFRQGVKEKEQDVADATEADGPTKNPGGLVFSFAPDWGNLIDPDKGSLPYGTDAWAIHSDMATITPLKASFAEPGAGSMGFGSEHKEMVNSRWARGGRFWDHHDV